MRKGLGLVISILMIISLAACAGNSESKETAASNTENGASEETSVTENSQEESVPAQTEETENGDGNILIAYFTYGENAGFSDDVDASASASIQVFDGEVTGNTGVMAQMIAEASGGELFSIRTAEPYPDDYDEVVEAGQSEKNDGIRPKLSTHIENLDSYDTVFVGFPNWWYGMPMVMYSFFDEYDFSGKTLIPFCTFGGSAFSDAIEEIKDMEPEADVLDGLHIGASSVADAESEVEEWVSKLDLSK